MCNAIHTKKYVKDLNTKRLNLAHGLATITIKVPKAREFELVMMANSMLIEAGLEPCNVQASQVRPENEVVSSPESSREFAHAFWRSQYAPEIAQRLIAEDDLREYKKAKEAMIAETIRKAKEYGNTGDPKDWLDRLTNSHN